MMKGADQLKYFHNNWPTNKGAWIPGENVFYREKSLFDDFSGESWFSLLIYGVRGVMPSPQEVKMVEHIASVCCSYPDPRLWNNRVAAICGSTRSTGALAVAAATAISEASIFGRRADIRGANFLVKVKSLLEDQQDLDIYLKNYLKQHRVIPGFGRPVISKDERINPLVKEAESLGFGDGNYLKLVRRIYASLEKQRYRIKPNISIHCAAIVMDMGWSIEEFYLVAIITFTAGIIPCYMDATEKSEGMLFPLNCNQIDYAGPTIRSYENVSS